MTEATTTNESQAGGGVAGRTNYGQWDRVATDLEKDAQAQEVKETEESSKALGLDGKYARSQAEADEREKNKEIEKKKKAMDHYKKRQDSFMHTFADLLPQKKEESKETHPHVVRITRESMDAGKRVVTISDTTGSNPKDVIVLTQDLNHLESAMPANTMQPPKNYKEDAENDVPNTRHDVTTTAKSTRKVYGLIKVFVSNVHNCTILVKCKLISGMMELTHCSNVTVKIEKEATVPTLQVDLCHDVNIEYHDAPSGKNPSLAGGNSRTTLFWGDDKDDRIFHAGVSRMKITTWRDGFVDLETSVDYEKNGAVTVGNATAEEYQFVTSVVDGELVTEKVLRSGATTGANVRAMTQREADEERAKREKAAAMAIEMAEKSIKFIEKNPKQKNPPKQQEKVEEEVYTSMTKEEIKNIVSECEDNKARGNASFGSGEYAQAVLLYTLALDKADELPDADTIDNKQPLFARHICLSNRSACFLKLGQHEKALEDATRAQELNPTYVKAVFRRGLALHAMGRYQEAMPILAQAEKLEPKNKQIQQALQFCEVRLTQEMRKRMEG